VVTVRVPAAPASVALVRAQIGADLGQVSIAPAVIEDVLLVASELLTNAIRHGEPLAGGGDGGEVTVAWQIDPNAIIVRVTDAGGASRPRVRHPSARDIGGRGLALVEAIASRWGVEAADNATTVWAAVTV
jgi:serine/threonine-protein kinase RsbW